MHLERPIALPERAYLQDHRFNGRPVLPAVEAVELLAATVQRNLPGCDIYSVRDARFDRFLPLENDPQRALWIELTTHSGRAATAVLTSKRRGQRGIARTFRHAVMQFGGPAMVTTRAGSVAEGQACGFTPPSAERIYTELVPFGASYRNIAEITAMDAAGVRANIIAPDLGAGFVLGNPFVLDAAFHAACIWGQRYADVVAFPVGFDGRRVLRPCTAGRRYVAQVRIRERDAAHLVFDIMIMDRETCCEAIRSVRMRDVSGGRLKAPVWMAVAAGSAAEA